MMRQASTSATSPRRGSAPVRLAAVMVLAVAASVPATVRAQSLQAPVVPQYAPATHLGVASCASGTCHGAATPADSGNVLLNEAVTWLEQDKHARFEELQSGELWGKITKNLGIDRNDKLCLDCHTDNVPKDRQGEKFLISDGIGCEACHGGSQNWIGVHTVADDANGHARNIAAGMFPTSDPKQRARLCLSCHFGDENKFVDHRLMGAGHPRLSFELDTFTQIEPAHFRVDDDYAKRKQVAGAIQTWAIGQGMALSQVLDAVVDPKRNHDGIFPEPVLFDCHACHQSMKGLNWQARPSQGLGPGIVRFNDANLVMLRIIAGVVSPPLAKKLADQGRAFHLASLKGDQQWQAAARQLQATAEQATDLFAQHDFEDPRTMRALLDALVREGSKGEYVDYMVAEQTTMAIGTLVQAMRDAGVIPEAEAAQVEALMDEMYAAVGEDERYRPTVALNAMKRVQSAAR